MLQYSAMVLVNVLLILIAQDLCAQNATRIPIRREYERRLEWHLGVGSQKGGFAGGRWYIGRFTADGSIGYDAVKKRASLNTGLGFIPFYWLQHFPAILSIVHSQALTQRDRNPYRVLTLNLGLISHQEQGLGYSTTVGAGVAGAKSFEAKHNSFFLNVELSVTFTF